MNTKRKRSSSTRPSKPKKKSTKKQQAIKTKGSQQVKYNVGEEVQYDPVHKGSTRRAQEKVKKVLTGPKVRNIFINILMKIKNFSLKDIRSLDKRSSICY